MNGNSTLTGTLTGLPIGDSSYTLASWIYSTGGNEAGGIIGFGNYGSLNQVNAFRLNGFNGLHSYWWANDLSASSPLTFLNGWNHVATTYDAVTDFRSIYINGNLVASATMTGVNAQPTNFAIGKTYSNEYFSGYLDDTAIFNESLNINQILDIKAGDFSEFGITNGVPEPNHIAFFAIVILGLVSLRFKKRIGM